MRIGKTTTTRELNSIAFLNSKWNTEDKALIIPQPKQSNPEKNFIRHIEGVFSKAIVGIDIKTKGVRIYIPIIAEYFIFSNFNFS